MQTDQYIVLTHPEFLVIPRYKCESESSTNSEHKYSIDGVRDSPPYTFLDGIW